MEINGQKSLNIYLEEQIMQSKIISIPISENWLVELQNLRYQKRYTVMNKQEIILNTWSIFLSINWLTLSQISKTIKFLRLEKTKINLPGRSIPITFNRIFICKNSFKRSKYRPKCSKITWKNSMIRPTVKGAQNGVIKVRKKVRITKIVWTELFLMFLKMRIFWRKEHMDSKIQQMKCKTLSMENKLIKNKLLISIRMVNSTQLNISQFHQMWHQFSKLQKIHKG